MKSSQNANLNENRGASRAFLAGGGEMGERMRAFDWGQTPLGAAEGWPQNLKTAVALMLGAAEAIAVLWGSDFILLYNDAWSTLIGQKHPEALGRPSQEVFSEVWETTGPLLASVMAGEGATEVKGHLLPLNRWGRIEDAWFDYSFNPLPGADGTIGGVFNIAVETTERVRAAQARQKSEEQLRLASGAAGLGVYARNLRTGEDYWSPEFLAIYGLEPDESPPLRDRIPAAVHPADREQVQAEARARLARTIDPGFSSEHRIIRPDGEIRWVLIQGEVTFDDEGRPLQTHGIAMDITERKQAEEALRESEARYRTLFESIDEGFCIIKVLFDERGKPIDYRFLVTNPAFERHTGLVDVVGKCARELVPELEQRWSDIYGRVATTGEPAHFVDRSEAMDRWFEVDAFRIGDPEERKVALLFTDISAQKQAERALLESEERYRAIVEGQVEMVCRFRPDGTILFANGAYARARGTEPDKLVGANFWEYIEPEDRPGVRALLERLQPNRPMIQIENRFETAGGVRWTLWNNRGLAFAADGTATEIQSSGIDITERKEAEEALATLNETLEERVEERTQQVRAQEERYRTLFESIDEGFCIVEILFDASSEPVDFRFLETNPAFQEQSGLHDVVGKRMRELEPQLEPYWFDIYGQIALTGEPQRFTNRARELGDRWYDVYAFRVGRPEERKVAILFSDISARKQAEERIRALAAQLTLAEHEERGRIAQILHDDLQQQLYALQLQLGLLQAEAATSPGGEALLPELGEMEEAVELATETARNLSVDLSPPILEGDGLAEAIGWVAGRMREHYGLAVNLEIEPGGRAAGDGDASFPVPEQDRRVLLFRTVRELLFNAVKHAGAQQVTVRLQHVDGAYRIDVVDEGAGFDPEVVLGPEATARGRGLLHARERLRLVGGRLEVASAPGRGTRVTIVAPPGGI